MNQQEANEIAKKNIEKQMDFIKELTPPRPAPSPFSKPKPWLYSRAKVRQIIRDVADYLKDHDLEFEFEARLNDKWLNGNNWANEDKYEAFMEDFADNFIS